MKDLISSLDYKLSDSFINDFRNYFLVDWFMCNPDRHLGDIVFEIKDSKYLELFPLFHLGFSLGVGDWNNFKYNLISMRPLRIKLN